MGDLFHPVRSLHSQYEAGKGQKQSVEGTHGRSMVNFDLK